MFCGRFLSCPAMLLLLVTSAFADSKAGWSGRTESPEELLAGTSSRKWTLTDTHKVIASLTPCTTPTTYQFYADKHMTIEQCGSGGRLATTTHPWKVLSQDAGDVFIQIDNDTYSVLVKGDNPVYLTLRSRAKSKISPTTDRVFRSP